MRVFFLIFLMILPGSWLAFGPGSNHLSYAVRFALTIALSPAVTAIQFYGLRLVGLTFQQVVPALQILNLGIGRAFGSRWQSRECEWLRANGIGLDLFSDDNGRAVYLISPWHG
jgi:hypothetical protein